MYSVNTTATGMAVGCVDVPCTAGKLYFPGGKGCHRVGTQGPCPAGQIVLFQDTVKTSIEGVSYLGMCGCANADAAAGTFYSSSQALTCKPPAAARRLQQQDVRGAGASPRRADPLLQPQDPCGHRRGTVAWTDLSCKQLYLQGPCEPGEWVVPDRGKGTRKGRGWKMGKCECRPGFTAVPVPGDANNATSCQPPTVTLAKFLNMSEEFNHNHNNNSATADGRGDGDDDNGNNNNNGVRTR
jgi:hypothetical protein